MVLLEGIYFYWFAWIAWVIYTFFITKNKKRTWISCVVLLLIIGSIHYIPIFVSQVNISFLILVASTYIVISFQKKRAILYILLSSLIITLSYVSFHLYELFDPVWLVFNRNWMLAFIIVYLTLMLHKDQFLRVVVACTGLVQGEILYGLIMKQYNFPFIFGSFRFFDAVALTVLITSFWNLIEIFSSSLEKLIIRKNERKAGVNS